MSMRATLIGAIASVGIAVGIAVRIGVCYDSSLTEDLPCADHDQRMNWGVTPTKTIHCTPIWQRECAPPQPSGNG